MSNTTTKTRTKTTPSTQAEKETEAPIIPVEINPNQLITVYNGFQGRLVYVSSRTGERIIWDRFGADQDIELRDLRSAKSASRDFFENNWFMFSEDDAWVINYLGVGQYYKNAIKLEEFDDILKGSSSKIEKALAGLSKGQKQSVAYRARELVLNGDIDSRKAIAAIEQALGVTLIEQ